MKEIIRSLLVGLVVGGLSAIQTASAETVYDSESKTVPNGKRTFLSNYVGWHKDCTSNPIRIEILDPPKHGKVSQKPGVFEIENLVTGSLNDCLGKKVRGIALYYKSDGKFRGKDKFRFLYRYVGPDDEPVITTYTVSVR